MIRTYLSCGAYTCCVALRCVALLCVALRGYRPMLAQCTDGRDVRERRDRRRDRAEGIGKRGGVTHLI